MMTTMSKYEINSNGQNMTVDIQKILDKAKNGSNIELIFNPGIYKTGSLRIYSNTKLSLKAGCRILAYNSISDFTDFNEKTKIQYVNDKHMIRLWNLPKHYFKAIFGAYNAENITICGEKGSLIDGNNIFDPNGEEHFRGQMGLTFSNVKNLKLEGYEVINSANWSHAIIDCSNVNIQRVKINGGHDGFNLHYSRNIKIEHCVLNTGDDCIAGYEIKDLKISNCWLNTSCNTFRCGGTNFQINKCAAIGPGEYPYRHLKTYFTHDFFRFYSLTTDSLKLDSSKIVFHDMSIQNCRSLVRYYPASEKELENNRQLKELVFENCQIENMKHMSHIIGGKKEINISFYNCLLRDLKGFKISENVHIKFENCLNLDTFQIENDGQKVCFDEGILNFQI